MKLEADEAERRFKLEPKDRSLTPEQAYDRNWALALINQVMAELRSEYVASGRCALFDTLEPLLLSGEREASLEGPARSLGMSPHAVSVVLHRLRRRLGQNLRAAVAETVIDPPDVKVELSHLIAALR